MIQLYFNSFEFTPWHVHCHTARTVLNRARKKVLIGELNSFV